MGQPRQPRQRGQIAQPLRVVQAQLTKVHERRQGREVSKFIQVPRAEARQARER